MYTLQKASAIATGAIVAWTVWLITVRFVEHGSGEADVLILLAFVGVAALLLTATRPVLAAIAVIGFAFVNPSLLSPFAELGELSFRYVDILCVMLTLGVLTQIAIKEPIPVSREFRRLFIPLCPFFLYVGASLIEVSVTHPLSFPFRVHRFSV